MKSRASESNARQRSGSSEARDPNASFNFASRTAHNGTTRQTSSRMRSVRNRPRPPWIAQIMTISLSSNRARHLRPSATSTTPLRLQSRHHPPQSLDALASSKRSRLRPAPTPSTPRPCANGPARRLGTSPRPSRTSRRDHLERELLRRRAALRRRAWRSTCTILLSPRATAPSPRRNLPSPVHLLQRARSRRNPVRQQRLVPSWSCLALYR